MEKIIALLKAIQGLSESEPTATAAFLWPHLYAFGDLWGDELRKMDWRNHLDDQAPRHCTTWALQHSRRARVEAMMVTHSLANIPLSWGIVDISDALESSSAILDIELSAAAEWFAIATSQIREAAIEEQPRWKTAVKRDLWKDEDVMNMERWGFWQQRVQELVTQDTDEATRAAAYFIMACLKGDSPLQSTASKA